MPTHYFLRTSAWLAVLPFLSLTALANEPSYRCNSETAPMYHQDCVVAANQLILSLTRSDGLAHVPNDDISHTFGGCHAELKATGAEKSVPASSLLLSFAQVAARCQDGSFSLEGSLEGALKGHADWRRSEARSEHQNEPYNHPRAVIKDFHARRDSHLSSEAPQPHMIGARKAADGKIYKLFLVSEHGSPELIPTSNKMQGTFFQRSREFLDHHKTRDDAMNLVFGNSYPIAGGTHVTSVSLGLSLTGGQTSWRQFVEDLGDHAKVVKLLVEDATVNFEAKRTVAAYYRVADNEGKEILGIILYGYNSVDSDVPS